MLLRFTLTRFTIPIPLPLYPISPLTLSTKLPSTFLTTGSYIKMCRKIVTLTTCVMVLICIHTP